MADVTDVFEEARRAVRVEDVAGVKLYPTGGGLRGMCPLCRASENKKQDGAFQVYQDGRRWRCHVCDPGGGTVIDLEYRINRDPDETLRDVALRLLAEAGQHTPRDHAPPSPPKPHHTAEWKKALAVRLWREAVPAAGTLVETYLRERGARGPNLDRALTQVRFNPDAYYHGHPDRPRTAPAMIGLRMTPWGPTGGVHVTYLSSDGLHKTDLVPARRAWGPMRLQGPDGLMHPGGVWLSRPTDPGPLVIGEGYETVIAAAILLGQPCRMVATTSLGALQGYPLQDSRGLIDLRDLQPDPALPAFVWPEPDSMPWGAPNICIDRDMKPVEYRAAGPDGVPVTGQLSSEQRAAMCAVLAGAAWLSTGSTGARYLYPPDGMDCDDLLRARRAGLQDTLACETIPLTRLPDDVEASTLNPGVRFDATP